MDRDYAHEVVTDVMHSQLPNLATAQRARDQAEYLREINAELLQALQWIADCGDFGEHGRPAYHDMRAKANAAIAKTQGKTRGR